MRNINWKVFGLDTKLKGGGESFLKFFAQYRNSTGIFFLNDFFIIIITILMIVVIS